MSFIKISVGVHMCSEFVCAYYQDLLRCLPCKLELMPDLLLLCLLNLYIIDSGYCASGRIGCLYDTIFDDL
jgi:hypothetical protein